MLRRRKFLQFGAAAIAATASPALATAAYPARPVYLIVGFSAGGNTDLVARILAQWLWQKFGQPFVVENRTGAATNLATEQVIRAPPDGHTLLVASAANAINATLFRNLKFNFIRDTEPVAAIASAPLVMCVHPSFPPASVAAFIEYAKSKPNGLNFGSSGVGSPPHVATELFKRMAGVTMQHVPYRGDAEAISDLIGGRVQVYFATLPGSMEFIRARALRALAVTATERSSALPEVAAMAEFLPGYDASIWNGISAPKGTPEQIVAALNRCINEGLADPKVSARLAELGAKTRPGTPGDYARLVAGETDKWGAIVRSTGSYIE
ncbi:tripartite tricarboxylate transporter substrate binding protein [Bradyrhizobium lablabi]|uniref:tripartite tricarboxylate transporter substrate binding protein n=1 Tax=Bradyrhizobium lablabi TaxID=722472 RepID=UPI001BAA58F5|nr:tripartite tricarboxylate transporter substrate binding protein [Bradyrhizobium lablabi]MBR0697269.1 tripartite tricarboxylate transporter substrate binding protein [Bradyrhizobium lablabi]